jgi:glycosyltransferase involved in cell wall biosynthesis
MPNRGETMTAVSIITPVWNGLPFLTACVESVQAQQFEDWELLISDDGSTDGSREWLATLADRRIRIFEQSRNLGIFGNLNFLFDRARAPVSQILCQDDYFADSRSLAKLMGLWNEVPARVGFIRENWSDGNSTNEIGRWGRKHLPEVIESRDSDLIFFVFGCIAGNLSNISVRTPLVKSHGGFDQSFPYAGDYQFWSRLGRSSSFLLESGDLTRVRRHPGQASVHLNRHAELVAQQYAIVQDLFDRLKDGRSEFLLRLHATIQYDSFQRWVAIRRLLNFGGTKYLTTVDAEGSAHGAFLATPLRWLLFLLTGGGRLGCSITARWLLSRDSVVGDDRTLYLPQK